jgi:hypothetical protein
MPIGQELVDLLIVLDMNGEPEYFGMGDGRGVVRSARSRRRLPSPSGTAGAVARSERLLELGRRTVTGQLVHRRALNRILNDDA